MAVFRRAALLVLPELTKAAVVSWDSRSRWPPVSQQTSLDVFTWGQNSSSAARGQECSSTCATSPLLTSHSLHNPPLSGGWRDEQTVSSWEELSGGGIICVHFHNLPNYHLSCLASFSGCRFLLPESILLPDANFIFLKLGFHHVIYPCSALPPP